MFPGFLAFQADELAELAAAVDPTGVADIVAAFDAEDCTNIKAGGRHRKGFWGGPCGMFKRSSSDTK